MLINILAKIFAGAVVGYATNYLAIKMLFQEYFKIVFKPWKINFSLGGVIIKERQQFETKISQLVESDVIHHHAVEQELRKPEFEQVLNQLISNLLEEKLPDSIAQDLKIADIPKIELGFENLHQTFQANLAPATQKILQQLLTEENLRLILPENQFAQIKSKLWQLLLDFLKNDFDSQSIVIQLLSEIRQRKISDFLPAETSEQLSKNLVALLNDLHKSLQFSYVLPVDDLLQKTIQTLDTEQLIQQIAEQLAQKHLYEIFTAENVENLPRQITQHIQNLFLSDVSNDIIQTLLKFLLGVLREEKATIFELLSSDLKANFERFLQTKLPDLLQTLIPWIRQKKVKLEFLIQEAFQENTSVIGQILVALFLGNIGEYVGIEEKLIDLIEKQDTNQLANQASDYVLKYLKENTIGDIIQKLNQERILTTLSPILHHQITDSLSNFRLVNISDLLDKPIHTWFSTEKIADTLRELLDNVLDKQLKDNWLFEQKFTDFVQNQLEKNLLKFFQRDLSQLLPEEKLPEYAENLKDFLLKNLPNNFNLPFDWKDLGILKTEGGDSKLQIPNNLLVETIDKFLKNQFNQLKDNTLHTYIDKLNDIPNLDEKISTQLKKYVLDHLAELIEGRVENLVKENLAKQEDMQLRGMVYKAMGEELEPLSLFGGVLGAITGLMLVAIDFDYQKAILFALLVSGLAYGITGWGTNWLAIKMLFRPYYGIKIPFLKRNLPFTPGVIAKNKARFARSMGRFLGDRLLNQENLQDSFRRNQPKMSAGLTAMLSENEYAFIQKLLTENQGKLAQLISEEIYKFLSSSEGGLSKNINNWLDKNEAWSLGNLNTKSIENQLDVFLKSEKINILISGFIQQKVQDFSQHNKALRELLSEDFLNYLPRQISKILQKEIQNLSSELTVENILKLINFGKLETRVEDWLQNNLEQILNDQQEERLKDQIFVFLRDKLQSEEVKSKIFEFIDKRLNNEFAPHKPIKEILGGRMLELLESNLNQVLQRIVQLGVEWLQKNKEKIAERIYEDAYKQTALAWTYKSSIYNTTFDLIDQGIPNFFQQELGSLKTAISHKMVELGESPFSSSELPTLDSENLKEKVSQILQNPQLIRKTRQLTNIILEERIFKIPLRDLITGEAEELLNHFQTLLTPEINLIIKHLQNALHSPEKMQILGDAFAELLNSLAHRHLLTVKTDTLLNGIDKSILVKLSPQISDFLLHSTAFQQIRQAISPAIFAKLKTLNINDLLEIESIKNTLGQNLQSILNKAENRTLIMAELESFLQENLSHLNQNLPTETKTFVVETASKAIFGALESNLLSLIISIDFKGIVVREIEAMHPKELEGLFYGFAQKYFAFLIGYGFIFGIIFGWAIDFGILGLFSLFMRK